MSNNYDIVCGDVYSVEQTFTATCADKSIRFEAEAGFAIQALTANDYAMKIALSNRQSVINAVTNIAAIGISLNPAKKQAYLVPRDGRICLDISYMGLMDLAIASGSLKWGQCRLVHEADDFELVGIDKEPVHRFRPFAKDRGPIVGVYCVVKTSEGDYLTHCMEIGDVFAIRDRSSAWKAYVEKKRSCPWVTDEGEMVKKTCVKQAYKYWPKTERSTRLEQAIHYLNTEAGEGLHKEAETGSALPAGGAPKDGYMERQPIEVQNYLRELAGESQELFKVHGTAAAFDRIKADELDEEQTIALWGLLPADMRRELKAEGKARAEAKTLAKAA